MYVCMCERTRGRDQQKDRQENELQLCLNTSSRSKTKGAREKERGERERSRERNAIGWSDYQAIESSKYNLTQFMRTRTNIYIIGRRLQLINTVYIYCTYTQMQIAF